MGHKMTFVISFPKTTHNQILRSIVSHSAYDNRMD